MQCIVQCSVQCGIKFSLLQYSVKWEIVNITWVCDLCSMCAVCVQYVCSRCVVFVQYVCSMCVVCVQYMQASVDCLYGVVISGNMQFTVFSILCLVFRLQSSMFSVQGSGTIVQYSMFSYSFSESPLL